MPLPPTQFADSVAMALAAADIGVWDWRTGEGMVQVNPRWHQIIGYQPGELDLSGFNWYQLVHPDDLDVVHVMAIEQALHSASGQFQIEFRMRHKTGHWVWVQSRGQILERDANGAPLRLAGAHIDITTQKSAEETIKQLAFYDQLTQLPNRQLLMERLKTALLDCKRNKHHAAVLFIDLDNFKILNDTKGHQTGDLLLQQVGARLIACVREVDTVARIGGDEFVVILKQLHPAQTPAAVQAKSVGQKILAALNEAYVLNGFEHHSTPSMGAVLFNGDQLNLDELLKCADMAMYQAKADGRNLLRFFDPEMQAAVAQRTVLEAALRLGLQRGEICLYYQRVVDQARQVIGYEALARWNHPTRGLVSPLEFIPLAEESGLILPLGAAVLRMACKQLAHWSQRANSRFYTVSVNVSARQFRQRDFVTLVSDVLHETGANARLLKLELTESLLLSDVEDVVDKMLELKGLGVGFSLDDFGTGYSSLSYLKSLPLDQLKIDKSFVRDVFDDPSDAAIVVSILTLAKALGLNVVAEGVETEGQLQFLLTNGCKAFQGYLFGKPLPPERL